MRESISRRNRNVPLNAQNEPKNAQIDTMPYKDTNEPQDALKTQINANKADLSAPADFISADSMKTDDPEPDEEPEPDESMQSKAERRRQKNNERAKRWYREHKQQKINDTVKRRRAKRNK